MRSGGGRGRTGAVTRVVCSRARRVLLGPSGFRSPAAGCPAPPAAGYGSAAAFGDAVCGSRATDFRREGGNPEGRQMRSVRGERPPSGADRRGFAIRTARTAFIPVQAYGMHVPCACARGAGSPVGSARRRRCAETGRCSSGWKFHRRNARSAATGLSGWRKGQARDPCGGMAGSTPTPAALRKAACRIAGRLMAEAAPLESPAWEIPAGTARGGGFRGSPASATALLTRRVLIVRTLVEHSISPVVPTHGHLRRSCFAALSSF